MATLGSIGGNGGLPPGRGGGGKKPFGHKDDDMGDFIDPKRSKNKKKPKMTWNALNDRKLLLFGLGKNLRPSDHHIITRAFEGKIAPALSRPWLVIMLTYVQ